MRHAVFALAALAASASIAFCQAPAKKPAAKPAELSAIVSAHAGRILDSVQTYADCSRASTELGTLFDSTIAVCPAADADSFREADFALRLITQVSQAAEHRKELLAFLRKNDALARDLVFLVKPQDNTSGVYALLDRLREKYGDDLNRFAALTAALCVVHDQKFLWRINENKVEAADPVEIFEFFRSHERSMTFPLTKLPPELLISVVDVTSSIDELSWANAKYAGDTRIGQRYFDVKYDYDAFRKGSEKKVTKAGFSLPNILSYGGVCADQTYFAMEVGKAIGIPTAWVSGRNAEVAHAWVGFVESKGDRIHWNFDSGHYDGYKGVRGEVTDPQTRQRITDSTLSLLAETSTANASARHAAISMTDAALRLGRIEKARTPFPPPTLSEPFSGKKAVRQAAIADRLELLEAALRKCPTYAPGWEALTTAAAAGELSLKDKQRWAKVLDNLCGAKYPDFSLDVLRSMVLSVEDTRDQDALWNSLFAGFQKRPDLAAEIRFAQGGMWEKAGDKAKAWDCYQDVIKRFADDGPFTVDAARRCEKLLKDASKDSEITPMYGAIWPRLAKPKGMAPEFQSQSNWFRIGSLYAARLESEGRKDKSAEVLDKLGVSRK